MKFRELLLTPLVVNMSTRLVVWSPLPCGLRPNTAENAIKPGPGMIGGWEEDNCHTHAFFAYAYEALKSR